MIQSHLVCLIRKRHNLKFCPLILANAQQRMLKLNDLARQIPLHLLILMLNIEL